MLIFWTCIFWTWTYFLYSYIHKDNLWNWLNQHLDTTLGMFTQTYFTWESLLSRCHDMLERWKGVGWCYHLRIHFHSMFVSLDFNFNIYVSMIMTSYMVIGKMLFISSYFLLTFGCGRWDYELYWTTPHWSIYVQFVSLNFWNWMHHYHFLCVFFLPF